MSSNARKHRTVSECFHAHNGRLIDKWEHYLPIYEHYFAKFVGTDVKVLEIGVSHGGSLQLWKQYFGEKAQIMGLDIDPRCKAYEEDRIEIIVCDAADKQIDAWLPGFDIVIDDGSHLPRDQIASFGFIWPNTKSVYLIEDCHHGMPGITAPEAMVSFYPW